MPLYTKCSKEVIQIQHLEQRVKALVAHNEWHLWKRQNRSTPTPTFTTDLCFIIITFFLKKVQIGFY